jgi:hypothetical protein
MLTPLYIPEYDEVHGSQTHVSILRPRWRVGIGNRAGAPVFGQWVQRKRWVRTNILTGPQATSSPGLDLVCYLASIPHTRHQTTQTGIQFGLYFSCFLYLWRRRKQNRSALFLLAYITTLFSLEFFFVVVQGEAVQIIYIDNRNYPGESFFFS